MTLFYPNTFIVPGVFKGNLLVILNEIWLPLHEVTMCCQTIRYGILKEKSYFVFLIQNQDKKQWKIVYILFRTVKKSLTKNIG